jgi:hypothetical protein
MKVKGSVSCPLFFGLDDLLVLNVPLKEEGRPMSHMTNASLSGMSHGDQARMRD